MNAIRRSARSHPAAPSAADSAAKVAAAAITRHRIRRLRARSLRARRRASMNEFACDVLQELHGAVVQARRAAKPPLTPAPMVRAS